MSTTTPQSGLPLLFDDTPCEPIGPVAARRVKRAFDLRPYDRATQSWLDVDDISSKRRDSRRILMGRAFKMLSQGHAKDCREAWKSVRAAYNAGDFTLPANV